METDNGFITSGSFSASVIEPHFSNSEMNSSAKSLFFKTDWLLRNEAYLGVLKMGILELAESVSCQKIKLFWSLPFADG